MNEETNTPLDEQVRDYYETQQGAEPVVDRLLELTDYHDADRAAVRWMTGRESRAERRERRRPFYAWAAVAAATVLIPLFARQWVAGTPYRPASTRIGTTVTFQTVANTPGMDSVDSTNPDFTDASRHDIASAAGAHDAAANNAPPAVDKGSSIRLPEGGRFVSAIDRPISRVPILVGTASYGYVREALDHDRLPTASDVRLEELVNAFAYDDPRPHGSDVFALTAESAPAPWNDRRRVVRVGVRAADVGPDDPNVAPPIVALDVTADVAFNAARVASYRILGFEGDSASEIKNDANEAVQAVNVGAGHALTILYEVTPVASGNVAPPSGTSFKAGEWMRVTLRYRPVAADRSVTQTASLNMDASPRHVSDDLRFAAAVSAFGMILKGGPEAAALSMETVIAEASRALGRDVDGQRRDFIAWADAAMILLGEEGRRAARLTPYSAPYCETAILRTWFRGGPSILHIAAR